jgi:hypothetical protein
MSEASSIDCKVWRLGEPEKRQGVTLKQAHEVFRRFCEQLQAAPSVAAETGIEYKTVCDVLYGKVWPQARQQWIDLQP